MLIGSAERISDVYGRPIKDLTDIEILGYIIARKYYSGELKKVQGKGKEDSSENITNKLNQVCTIEKLLKYNEV